jgi:hypothetical protein
MLGAAVLSPLASVKPCALVFVRRYFETVRNHSTHISVRITDHLKSQAVAEGSECTFAEADNVLSRVAYVTPTQQWSIDIAQVIHWHTDRHACVRVCLCVSLLRPSPPGHARARMSDALPTHNHTALPFHSSTCG